MTEHEIRCTEVSSDCMIAQRDHDSVYLQAYEGAGFKVSVYAPPATARIFARGILALCDEIDGGETAPESLKVGDRVRVVRAFGASHRHGHVGTLRSTTCNFRRGLGDPHPYDVDFGDGDGTGVWAAEVELVECVGTADKSDDPAPEPARSLFARYVDEARTLLTGTAHIGGDVIELARELADRA